MLYNMLYEIIYLTRSSNTGRSHACNIHLWTDLWTQASLTSAHLNTQNVLYNMFYNMLYNIAIYLCYIPILHNTYAKLHNIVYTSNRWSDLGPS